MPLYQNYKNGSTPLSKMASRAKNRKKPLNNISSQASGQFQNNFTEMFLSCPFTKIAKMVQLC